MDLSPEQQRAYDLFCHGKNLFITGAAGTGKSYLIKKIANYCIANSMSYKVCALTGCAALLIRESCDVDATTVHSYFGIGLARGSVKQVVDGCATNYRARSNYNKHRIVIIDEVSMMSSKLFDICNQVGQLYKRNSRPFGGVQVIFTGDFFQLPPVNDNHMDEENGKFAFQNPHWKTIFPPSNCIELKRVYRQTDSVFTNILHKLREGIVDEEVSSNLSERVVPPSEETPYTKLMPTKRLVDGINNSKYAALQGEEFISACVTKTDAKTWLETGKPIEPEELEKCLQTEKKWLDMECKSIVKNMNAEESLKLKVGTVVMLTQNMDVPSGLVNGSIGTVAVIRKTERGLLEVTVAFSNNSMRMIPYKAYQSAEFPCVYVMQLPLIHAWAMTIHKSQGASIDCAEIDIGNSVFECGQTYVALSRIRSLEGVHIKSYNEKKIRANPLVVDFYKNYVRKCESDAPIVEESEPKIDETKTIDAVCEAAKYVEPTEVDSDVKIIRV